jgi:hypothetical protein
MVVVRIVLGALIAVLVVVLALPAVVLMDLVIGGTGLGLCVDGLGACDTSLFAVLELLLLFTAVSVALGFAVAGCLRFLTRNTRSAGQ